MRKPYLTVAVACTLAGSLMFSSCIGSFTLSNKLLSWNRSISNKLVNEVVFLAFWVLPVYEVSMIADVLVLNSIEFWSGNNPVASTGSRVVKGNDGNYLVQCDPKGYTITSENDGSVIRFDFDEDTNTWSMLDGERRVEIFTWVDDTHVLAPAADGSRQLVELTDAGLYAYQQNALGMQLAAR